MKRTMNGVWAPAEAREPFSENFFLSRGVVKLFGEVTDALSNTVIDELLYLDYHFQSNDIPRQKREVNLWINSPGGSVTAGLAIYDAMNYIDADVRTTCIGTAASMGAFLLSSGTRGKREALPHSAILIHQPQGGTQGQVSDIVRYAEHVCSMREELNTLLALHTGKPIEDIRRDTDRDYRMSAQAALEYGLIDQIIQTTVKAAAETGKEVQHEA